MLELIVMSTLNGVLFGMLLFLMASGLTVIFSMLISLFERAYLLLFDPPMSADRQRRWGSWEDYMMEWCQREDFREMLPALLLGEDSDFAEYIRALASGVRTPA